MLSTRKSTRSRRITARVAIAGALAVVPLAAVAGPALADTVGAAPAPSATQIDWRHPGGGGGWPGGGDWHHGGWPGGGGDWHHGGWPGDWHHGGWGGGGWGGPGPWVPPFLTGSAG